MVITIDGLGVNGKTTLARRISEELNFKNFNTGAIYRCIALEIINNNLDINDIDLVIEKISTLDINFDKNIVLLNGKDVSKRIKEEDITVKSTAYANNLKIKEVVRKIQKDFIKKYDTVMEGRDIGTRIAPDADVRFYLYSGFEKRVERLSNEEKGVDVNVIRENLRIRDDLDLNGGNFVKPVGAIEIDTTNLNLDDVYNIMMKHIKNIMK